MKSWSIAILAVLVLLSVYDYVYFISVDSFWWPIFSVFNFVFWLRNLLEKSISLHEDKTRN